MGADSLSALLAKLEAWREHDFHADRQLADEMLIATGWRVVQDPEWEHGIRWEFGTNPRYSSSESSRPHPINSLDDALGQLPFRWSLAELADVTSWAGEKGPSIVAATAAIFDGLHSIRRG